MLIVDDLDQNLHSLQALLRRDEAVEVLEARSGRDALELLLVHDDVALALVDVQMPEMDGFELAELMRGSPRTREVPIIFVTAGAQDQGRSFQGYEAGAVDFLFKPLEPRILAHKVEVFLRLFRQRRQLRAQVDELRANAEERERLVGELSESLRLAEMFSAVLGHDLRNPLSVVTTSAELLIRRSADEVVRRSAARIAANGQRMGRMIDQLLDMARARVAGGIPLSLGEADLLALCRKVVADHEISYPARGLQLHHQGNARGVWDEDRLFQVLSNLLGNALQHGKNDAPVSIVLDATGFSQVVLSVHNQGSIPPEILPYLFDPFRGRPKRPHPSRGLGLGLYIVHQIVEAHGGRVDVRSSEEGGTGFVVTLPRVTAAAAVTIAARQR
ncbi:MAG TPA: hybrid sensor histidine kinase/response regulator [Polyangia bacterium]|nr:hybrid sensor histidine kinase/response regulator [Polyangia bacterium]